jgi:hypothetical protein
MNLLILFHGIIQKQEQLKLSAKVLDKQGFSAKSAIVEVKASPVTGFSGLQRNPAIDIYPNPVTDFVHVKAPSGLNRVSVYSLTGSRKIYKNTEGTTLMLDLSELEQGIYLVKVEMEDGSGKLEKIVKSKKILFSRIYFSTA